MLTLGSVFFRQMHNQHPQHQTHGLLPPGKHTDLHTLKSAARVACIKPLPKHPSILLCAARPLLLQKIGGGMPALSVGSVREALSSKVSAACGFFIGLMTQKPLHDHHPLLALGSACVMSVCI